LNPECRHISTGMSKRIKKETQPRYGTSNVSTGCPWN